MAKQSRDVTSVAVVALLLGVLGSGCTFYTQCPNGTANNTGGSTAGGAGNQAGNGTGGDVVIPTGEWTNASGNLAGIPSECGNLAAVSAKPDEDLLIASISQNGLWASNDGGESWSQLGTGSGSDEIVNRMANIVYDPEDGQHWWEGGIYNGGGAYETKDNGDTFKMLGDLAQQGDLLSVDLGDPDHLTLLIGGHESGGALTVSKDGGVTWNPVGTGLPSGTNCSWPLIIDSTTFLVGCGGYGGGESGIYRSTDAGDTFEQVATAGGAGAPLHASDGAIYWFGPDGSMTRSTDNGETWVDVLDNGILVGPRVIELPDGRLASLAKRYVMVSGDRGKTWVPASSALPYDDSNPATGLTYSSQQKAFFIFHATCGFNGPVPVPEDAVMRYDFDYLAP